ncbi:hypothetical protein [Streptomyces sp. NPDC050504]|uniref:hypothetical protein n=1 Tax=Streptomyces sp. NPDC050504 TaxID=3365618 RepID=UPI00379A8881
MPQLYVRSGVDPDDPNVPAAVLVIDPEGTLGERALARLGGAHCHEMDGWACLLQTDGWAEHTRDGNRLKVQVAVHPAALRAVDVDPADFPGRSAVDPAAVLVLRAETDTAPEPSVPLSEGTAIYASVLDLPLDELLAAYDDWPMVLMPPPESPSGGEGDEAPAGAGD